MATRWEIDGLTGDWGIESDPVTGDDTYEPDFYSAREHWPNHLIGKWKVEHSLAELLEKLPQPGRKQTWNVVLKGECDRSQSTAPCDEDEPLYDVIYEITRVNDATAVGPLDPDP